MKTKSFTPEQTLYLETATQILQDRFDEQEKTIKTLRNLLGDEMLKNHDLTNKLNKLKHENKKN
jgi:hypothetical protein